MPSLALVPKVDLTPKQLRDIEPLVAAADMAPEVSPRDDWDKPGWERNFYAVVERSTSVFVGTVYCVIVAPSALNVAWWIAQPFRGKGYGRDLADALAEYLHSREVKTLGLITFRGSYYEASRRIAARLRARCEALGIR